MSDRGNLPKPPEAIAVIDKWLRSNRQRLTADGFVGLLKRRDRRIFLIQIKGVANKAKLGVDGRPRRLGDFRKHGSELALDIDSVRAGEPAPRSFEPGFVRILVEDFTAVHLTVEHGLATRRGIGLFIQL